MKIVRAVSLAAAVLLVASCACADPGPQRCHGPRPGHHGQWGFRPGRPHSGVWVGIDLGGVWVDLGNDSPPPRPQTVEADGVVTVVPPSPKEWTASRDIAAGTFEMSAPLSLPRSIAPQDVASVRAIFNDKADRSSISTTVSEEMDSVLIEGRAAQFAPLGRVELIQFVVEREDGTVLAQDLSIGLRAALGDDDVF